MSDETGQARLKGGVRWKSTHVALLIIDPISLVAAVNSEPAKLVSLPAPLVARVNPSPPAEVTMVKRLPPTAEKQMRTPVSSKVCGGTYRSRFRRRRYQWR